MVNDEPATPRSQLVPTLSLIVLLINTLFLFSFAAFASFYAMVVYVVTYIPLVETLIRMKQGG